MNNCTSKLSPNTPLHTENAPVDAATPTSAFALQSPDKPLNTCSSSPWYVESPNFDKSKSAAVPYHHVSNA